MYGRGCCPSGKNEDLFGIGACIDLEISVDGRLSLDEAHEISEKVRGAASGNEVEGRNITVHVNPAVV